MDEALVQAVTERVRQMLAPRPRALLIGRAPALDRWELVDGAPYEAVVIGSLTWGQVLHFTQDAALEALAGGLPVYLWEPGLPQCGKNRALASRLSGAKRELRSLGVQFLSGGEKAGFVSAERARQLLAQGMEPPAGAVLSPLARDILEGRSVGQ